MKTISLETAQKLVEYGMHIKDTAFVWVVSKEVSVLQPNRSITSKKQSVLPAPTLCEWFDIMPRKVIVNESVHELKMKFSSDFGTAWGYESLAMSFDVNNPSEAVGLLVIQLAERGVKIFKIP